MWIKYKPNQYCRDLSKHIRNQMGHIKIIISSAPLTMHTKILQKKVYRKSFFRLNTIMVHNWTITPHLDSEHISHWSRLPVIHVESNPSSYFCWWTPHDWNWFTELILSIFNSKSLDWVFIIETELFKLVEPVQSSTRGLSATIISPPTWWSLLN